MVFMVCLTSGSLLLLLCIFQASNATSPTSHTASQEGLSIDQRKKVESGLKNLNKINVSRFTDEDVENIVKPYKLSQLENVTTTKLKQSESYASTQEPSYGSSRSENGRSVDIDIEKFISPDFYNAVYTPPISTKDYTSRYDTSQYGTEVSYDGFDQLTTPSTPFFDKKYKETVESVNQKLEVEADIENLTHPPNYTSQNFVEDIAKNPNGTKIVYKIFENIGMNETAKPSGEHRDVVLETQTILSIERLHNESTAYEVKTSSEGINELHKKSLKYLIGEENNVKKEEDTIDNSPPPRTSYQLTTEKYSITKPSTYKNDAGILSNRIESDTLKSFITTTASSHVLKSTSSKSSVSSIQSSSTTATTVKIPELVYQENQIIPIQVTSPHSQTTAFSSDLKKEKVDVTSPLSKTDETTIKNENMLVRNNTLEPEEQQSTTVLIIVQPNEQKKPTTESNIPKANYVTIASTPRGFSLPASDTIISTTEMQKLPIDDNIMPTEFEITSAIKESTTLINKNTNTDGKYSAEFTTKDTTLDIETLEPSITKSSFTKYDISGNTDIPSTSQLPPTSYSTTDLSSSSESIDMYTEFPTTVLHLDGKTSTDVPEEMTSILEQTTASLLGSLDVLTTTEFETESPETSTKEGATTINGYTSSVSSEEGTTPIMIDTTITEEQDVTTVIPSKSSKKINTESSATKSPINKSTDDEVTTESATKIEFIIEQTTSSELRYSKGMRFTKESPMATEIMKDSTSQFPTVSEMSTSSPSETSRPFGNKYTIPVSEETTVKDQRTTLGVTTDTPSETNIVIDATATAILSSFQTSGKNITEHVQSSSTENINIPTVKQNKYYVTESPASSGTSNEPITADDSGHSAELEGASGTIVAIVISCVGGICLIALACLLVVMRNRQKRFNYGQRCKPVSMDQYSVDSVSVFSSVRRKGGLRHSKRSYGNPAFEDPVCMSHPLNFPAISKFAANRDDVEAEFGDIPQIIARTSELPEGCETKNRFANVIPLPESRVFLTPVTGYPNSDYINANYVTGPKNTRKYYIACQAPMSNTVDDFWRMIWEQQSKVILMLTHLFENGAERCFDYLPPSEVLDCHRLFGDYQVTLKKREVKEKYIISSLQLKNMVSNSWREVTHFWYMGWPEKGVPAEANSIIAFLIEARSYMKSATIDKNVILKPDVNGAVSSGVNPVVVHCCPGTGRTGTVITCDIAIREFEQTRQVDIPKIVYRIRRDRASAVQTKEQYAFIYKVIALYATKLAGGSLESI